MPNFVPETSEGRYVVPGPNGTSITVFDPYPQYVTDAELLNAIGGGAPIVVGGGNSSVSVATDSVDSDLVIISY